MGFGVAAQKPPPTMVLLALAADHWARGADDAVAAGADAVLLAGRPAEKELAEAVSAAGGRPCGLLAADVSADQLARLRQAGLDFLVLGTQAPASALLDEQLTFLLHLRDDFTDTQLRALDALPLDAIYAEREAAPATILRLMELQRLSSLSRKPLLITVPPNSQQEDLLALRDAGVALIALDMRDRSAADELRRLRGVIDGLPRRRLRREERPEAVLPRAAGEVVEEEEEEF